MRVTTDDSVIDDLRASVNARQGVAAGSTFGEFLAACRRMGIRDEDKLASIEFGVSAYGNGWITRDDDIDGISVREKR